MYKHSFCREALLLIILFQSHHTTPAREGLPDHQALRMMAVAEAVQVKGAGAGANEGIYEHMKEAVHKDATSRIDQRVGIRVPNR